MAHAKTVERAPEVLVKQADGSVDVGVMKCPLPLYISYILLSPSSHCQASVGGW